MPRPKNDSEAFNLIAGIVGYDIAMRLMFLRGGTRLFIPYKCDGDVLPELLGVEAAQELASRLGGERIEVPLSLEPMAFWLRDLGLSEERIANMTKTARRTIQYWLTGTTPRQEISVAK